MKFLFLTLSLLMLISNSANSQQDKQNRELELTYNILNQSPVSDTLPKTQIKSSGKSGGLAMLLSLVVPGAGHYYLNRMDVGKYFVAGEAASWLGFVGLNIYGDAVKDDARQFAVQYSGANSTITDDEYYTNIGFYRNIFDYNNDKLARGEFDKVYDVEKFYWYWNSADEQGTFETQRKKSERIFNARIIFTTGLIVNRLTSALSALLLANSNSTILRNSKIQTEFLKGANNKIDGMSLTFTKGF
ncbi:MAG TPA: hypothetical protein DEP28_06300 [Bacteroidetes bacterium]|nr:hypothetical protein [Bacteroidota bacterium]HCN36702.1 hypothetical protein [Bacteroidota bacterium]